MVKRVRLLVVLAAAVWLAGMSGIAASPAEPRTPDPAECRVTPRLFAELERLAAEPPTFDKLIVPPGPGALQEIREQVKQTIFESIACVNANDVLRWSALLSDQYVAERFGPAHPDDLGHLEAALTRSPLAAPVADRLSLLAVTDVEITLDWRVVAIVSTENRDEVYLDRVWFRWDGSRWLIDQTEPLDPLDA